MKLFPDQAKLLRETIGALNSGKRTIMCLPTGGGKTVIAGRLIQQLNSAKQSALVLVHRHELVHQFMDTLAAVGLAPACGRLAAGDVEQAWLPFCIASVQTLRRRLISTRLDPDLIIIDEAHHAPAKTYTDIIRRFSQARLLGLTATPQRADGVGLDGLFDVIVSGPNTGELIKGGRLAPYRLFSVDIMDATGIKVVRGDYDKRALDAIADGKAIADVVAAIMEHARNKRMLVFATSIKASKDLAERLNDAGIVAEHIDGSSAITRKEREDILRRFASGITQAICNVDLISEGFDCPECDCVVMARPTASLTIYLQQAGRALRYSPGKTAAILDCVGNVAEHGAPSDIQSWSLVGQAANRRSKAAANSHVFCPTCGALINKKKEKECARCGWVVESKNKRDKREMKVGLAEIDVGLGAPLTLQTADDKPISADIRAAAKRAYNRGGFDALLKMGAEIGAGSEWAQRQLHMFTRHRWRSSKYR